MPATADERREGAATVPGGAALPLGLHHLTRALNAIGTLWIFALMVLMTADVLGRNLFTTPIRGVLEIMTLSIVAIVFIQLADTLRNGQLTRADGWIGALMSRRPRMAHGLEAVFHIVGALLLGIMCVASVPLLIESWHSGEYLGAIGDFQAWVWPMRAIVVLGSGCTAVTFLLLACQHIRAAFERGKRA